MEFFVPEPFDPTQSERRTTAENARDSIEEFLQENQESDDTMPDVYYVDRQTCAALAATEIHDPVTEAWDWLASETAGLYERVTSDGDVVAAQARLAECIGEAGFDWVPGVGLDLSFFEESQAVVDGVRNGALTPEEAYTEVDRLNYEEREVWRLTDPCIERYLAVERRVAHQYESAWLDTEGSRLAARVRELEGTVAELEAELKFIIDGGEG